MLASAVIGSMESLGSGFGDATIKFVSKYRARASRADVERIIRANLAINGVLGLSVAAFVMLGSRFAVTRFFKVGPEQYQLSVHMLQIAGIILLLRSLESVFSNTLRAYEKFRRTITINIASRTLNLAASVLLAFFGHSVLAIITATLFIGFFSLGLQIASVRTVCGPIILLPKFDRVSLREIFSFGAFSWVQALAGAVFYNADRLVVGALMGTSALGIYAVCVQATQPIQGITTAALNFMFPHISARHEAGEQNSLKRLFRIATWANVALVVVLSTPLVLFGRQILTIWMGPVFAQQAYVVLEWLVCANACLGICVASHYILLALGQARFVAAINVLGGVLSLGCIALLMPIYGLRGAAIGRLLYAGTISLNFWKLKNFNFAALPDKAPTLTDAAPISGPEI
jgi:O-antigen/teichoic acid export membrane protein